MPEFFVLLSACVYVCVTCVCVDTCNNYHFCFGAKLAVLTLYIVIL